MLMMEDQKQLFISMREAIIFIFNISEIEPIVQHMIKTKEVIRSMVIDYEKNILMALDIRGTLIKLKVDAEDPTAIIEAGKIKPEFDRPNAENFKMATLFWLD
jgi:hypothetical protein